MQKSWEKGWPDETEYKIPDEPEQNTRIDYGQYFIPPKEQEKLFRRLRQMDRDSEEYRNLKNDLIMANLKLVYKVINDTVNLSSSALQVDELLSYGVEGLYAAIDRYDPERGRFSTVAYNHIRMELQSAIGEIGYSFSVTAGKAREIRKYYAIVEKLTNENFGVAPTLEEVAEEAGWSMKKTIELSQTNFFALSLDEKWSQNADGDDDERTLGSIVPDRSSDFIGWTESNDMVEWVYGFVRQRFNETAQKIFFEKAADPEKSYAQISRETGINPEAVRTIYRQIIEYLQYVLKFGKEPESKEDKKNKE